MRENQEEVSSNKISLIIFSEAATTDFSQVTRKGYAGRTKRLDILVRTLFLLLNNKYYKKIIDNIEIVMHGEPYGPINILIPKEFWNDYNGVTEGEQMVFFAEKIKSNSSWIRKKGFREVVSDYWLRNYIPVILVREGRYSLSDFLERIYSQEQDYVIIVGSDSDPPTIEDFPNIVTVSLGAKNYLLSHALLYFFHLLLNKKGFC